MPLPQTSLSLSSDQAPKRSWLARRDCRLTSGAAVVAFVAASAGKKPLTEVLRSALGDRFDSGQISQASLDARNESREKDKT
jgi:hypothetical protein